MLQKDYYAAVDDYNHGILSGSVKIASKMGISTIQSYQGAKIFEAIGLKEEFINRYFTDTVSRVGGIGIEAVSYTHLDDIWITYNFNNLILGGNENESEFKTKRGVPV